MQSTPRNTQADSPNKLLTVTGTCSAAVSLICPAVLWCHVTHNTVSVFHSLTVTHQVVGCWNCFVACP